MEPAQPADRVPADQTPPQEPPSTSPARATDLATSSSGPEPAVVEPPAGTAGGEPALVAPPPAGAGGPRRVGRPAGKEKARSERSPKDMALSLLVLLVPIALLLAFYRGFLGGEQPVVVDPGPAYESARSAGAFPISEPTGLGSGWRTVSASYRAVDGGANLRVGYLTPEGRGVQLVQSNVPPEKLLPHELTVQGQPQGPTDLGGRSWQRYTGRGNDQALVLLEPDRTVIVVGDAREGELRQLAGALR
ncbi:DUF4245 domain-containing protein [Micromonospora sp. KC721]|uniref:DUF4245 domain-containing protein n=1 Tax=Micromonospora sp. KC721 TaxID=2530380 RepID=UPI00104827F8|nr:DUF4245 domain-containing protein [Micromonospora sp. KC721]TDB77209.1 DUF4245 family protein [Micromonospora sp. KC721]